MSRTNKEPEDIHQGEESLPELRYEKSVGMSNFLKQLRYEEDLEKSIEEKLKHSNRPRNSSQIEFENCLVDEIRKANHERFVEEKARQQLRETNHELKELESKLRSAYVAKSIAAQIAEKEQTVNEEKRLQQLDYEAQEKARFSYIEQEKIKKKEVQENKMKFRDDLQEQMDVAYLSKLKKYEDFLKEKKILDDIINKINEEHLACLQEKLLRKAKYREDMERFMHAKEIWKEKEKQQQNEEDERLIKYIEEREEKLREEQAKKLKEEQSKTNVSEKLGVELKEMAEARRRRENVLIDLQMEEMKAKDEQKYREELEAQMRMRILTRLQLDSQKEDLARRRLREQEEDRRYREEQMEYLAERDKLELLSNEKRRRKILEHRKSIEECLEERKLQRTQEVLCMIKQRDEETIEEKRRQQLIEEERIRMLQEHAKDLIGFLPPGILRESDRQYLALPPP